jgi:SAM-dependent methyltransferase
VSSLGLFSRLYDPIMEVPENLGLQRLRREALRGVQGRVLELGIGTGRNFPLYPAAVDYLVGIDPDEAMLRQARRRAGKASFPVELLLASAEDLPFEEDSFDAVVGTLVFCTISDPPQALREVRRVLKPRGEFHLLEHVRIERKPVARIQEKATPLWKHVAGGCHLDRDTLGAVRDAGFEVGRVEPHLGGLILDILARPPSPKWPRLAFGCAGRL